MSDHRNATLGPAGRRRIVEAVAGGLSQKRAAARFCVSPATVNRWVKRARAASAHDRATGSCFEARSSRPHRSPRMLSERDHQRVLAVRERTGWGPRLIAGEVGLPHSTVHAALKRRGCSRPAPAPREPVVRYEWPCPGDLLHVDSKRFERFTRPGWAVTGDPRRSGAEKRMRIGHEFVHSMVDDHSRLAYSELHRDARAATVTGFVERALVVFGEHGIEPRRLLTDNAFSYVKNRTLRELLERRGIRHLRTEPWRPQTNGKVERYQQTLKREWGLGQVYRSSDHRAKALQHWLWHYNHCRPHSAIGGRPPISRVHNLPGQNI